MCVTIRFRRWSSVVFLLAAVGLTDPLLGAEADLPPWQSPYTGEDATGNSVIALWHFNTGEEAKDDSGNGHDLTLRGQSRYVDAGRYGSCLESFPAGQENDMAQGALAKNHASLSPAGAFTIEMWFQPKPEMDDYASVFLLDKKYFHYAKDLPQANQDYCLYMPRTGPHRRRITAYLGYGEDSAAYTSQEVELLPERWHHVAFAYDGAGTGRFFLDGQLIGRVFHERRGPVEPGNYHLVIGCRYGSIHSGFPGYIDEVRISNGVVPSFSGSLEVAMAGKRLAFIRMEDAHIPVGILNDTSRRLSNGKACIVLAQTEHEISFPDLAPKETHTVDLQVDTTVRPGAYPLQVTASATADGRTYEVDEAYELTIVPRPLPQRMPVVMWGGGDFETLKAIGFTHQLASLVDYGKVWRDGKPTTASSAGRIAELAESLDQHLIQGIGAVANVYPGRWVIGDQQLKKRFERIDRDGKPYGRENPCARFPEIQYFAYNVGASVAQTFGRFPALQSALIHTEIRDRTNLCFHEHDRGAFRDVSGYDIPEAAIGQAGVDYTKMEDFPENRLVPDDDPLLTFYRWFWKAGDGWNTLHTQVHRGLKSTGRDDLWTFFDPAVRVPSVWGSGGGVDVLSQWTYSYPDPIKIGQATDELFAMAEGASHDQRVMKMTQVIWYRSQTAPELPEDESKRVDWEKRIPDAQFVTIAPDHLREAFWSKISRPVQGIMYHGWGSLVGAAHGGYRYTNPRTREVLAELVRDVVEPLGPTLLQVPDRVSDVALLESFASQVFARRGTRGWSHHWESDAHLVLQWAQIQPRIVYDETVLRDGLDSFRVLVLPHCDVLTESVAKTIEDFQKDGGILIADETLTPALKPDIVFESYRRVGKAEEDKQALQAKAGELRRELDPKYQRYGDSSDPNVVVRFRQYGNSDYLFVLNDKRTFGDYVGHHGKVMEKGQPSSATLTVTRNKGHVYDLVRHKAVPTRGGDSGIQFGVDLGPGGGRVFLITEREISGLQITAAQRAKLGGQLNIRVAVVDEEGEPVKAVVPIEVAILDPQSQPAEFSGYYGAKDGQLSIVADLAQNDLAGEWTVRVKELASGRSKEQKVAVQLGP